MDRNCSEDEKAIRRNQIECFWQQLKTEHVHIYVKTRKYSNGGAHWSNSSYSNETAKALLADRVTQIASGGWQKMEKAPRDGTHILAKLCRPALDDEGSVCRKAFMELREIWYKPFLDPIFGFEMPWHAGDPFGSRDGMASEHMSEDVPIAWLCLPDSSDAFD